MTAAATGSDADLRIVVVDDHELFRTGLRRLLENEAGMTVVGDARRGEEAVQRARELRPDVMVLDVNMPDMTGIEATRGILQASPTTAVIMLTISDANDDVLNAVLAGASGYLLKDAQLPEIVRAIRAAAAGESIIAPRVTGELLARLREHGPGEPAPSAAPDLSERELHVLTLLVAGYDNVEIGTALHLSASTIKHHVSSIFDKLGVENRIQAAVLAVRLKLVDERAADAARRARRATRRVIRTRRRASASACARAPGAAPSSSRRSSMTRCWKSSCSRATVRSWRPRVGADEWSISSCRRSSACISHASPSSARA